MKKIIKAIFSPSYALRTIQNRLEDKKLQLYEKRCATKDSASIHSDEKVLFVDLGANLGQGYSWFKNYFNTPNIFFELFEPNPNCLKKLEQMDDVITGKITLHPVGVGKEKGSFDFYGTGEEEGGKFSEGGSISRNHILNLSREWWKVSEDNTIKVNIINFSEYLESVSAKFDKIIVKMDIEGAEVELLEALLEKNTANLISILYVEFHAQYLSEEHSLSTKKREEKILKDLSENTNVNVRIWH